MGEFIPGTGGRRRRRRRRRSYVPEGRLEAPEGSGCVTMGELCRVTSRWEERVVREDREWRRLME